MKTQRTAAAEALLEQARAEGPLTLDRLRVVFEEEGLSPVEAKQVVRELIEAGAALSAPQPEGVEEPDLDEEPVTTDLVRQYLQEIGKVALLDAAQEVQLAKRIEAGLFAEEKLRTSRRLGKNQRRDLDALVADGQRAKAHLLEANLRLVVSLAKRYQHRGLPLLDLIQEGNLGLVRAVEKFDYAKGYKFSTYATWWIRQALQRALADQGRTIRVPVHMAEQINKVARIRRELAQELQRDPSVEELAVALELPVQKVQDILDVSRDTVSLQAPVGEDAVLADFIEDSDAPDVGEVLDAGMLRDRLDHALAGLPPRSAKVMELRFGLTDGNPRTLDEVGRELGLTRERIRQIEAESLRALRRGQSADDLRSFIA